MFVDMVGYTAATQADEARTMQLLREQEELVRPILADHGGREVKSTGDGFLVEFDSALKATQCAIEIQRWVHERNAKKELVPLQLRIGIHLGDVEQRGSDIFGDAVNIASRIESVADPGGISLSSAVQEQVRNKIPERLEKLAPVALKGLQGPMDVYRVVLPWAFPEVRVARFDRPRLAVLPLANISPDSKDEYFADGLTEELIASLSKIRGLRVIARTSVGQYKSTSKTVSQIANELGVSSVLEGSVRKAGNRLRITLQLIDAGSQDHIWADSFDRELDDVFTIQTEVAERTAGALQLELLGPERESIRKEPTANLAAYELYLRGVHAIGDETIEEITDSMRYFEEAIRRDPKFSLPYARLAYSHILLSSETMSPKEAFPRAKELIAKALELDPDSSDVHAALGNLALQQDQDWVTAERELKKAISLNPSSIVARETYATLLRVLDRTDEAIEELNAAVELDPLMRLPLGGLWFVHQLRGDDAVALALAEKLRDLAPHAPFSHVRLAYSYARSGRVEDARHELDLLKGATQENLLTFKLAILASLGQPDEVRQWLKEREAGRSQHYVSTSEMATVYAALGEKEKVFEWLERDQESGDRAFWNVYQFSVFDFVRDDPRFGSLLARMNLPTSWRGIGGPIGPLRG
jgi:adenylate cyclase